jgi:predicted transcriptional regulator
MPGPSTASLKLDTEMKERVQRLASARRRTPHWIMREAVAEQGQLKPLLAEQQFGSAGIAAAYDTVAKGSKCKVVLEL